MSVPLFPALIKAADVVPSAHLVKGEPDEIGDLPAEVRQLIHRVDAILDRWAEADEAARRDLWRSLHEANQAVWDRNRELARVAPH